MAQPGRRAGEIARQANLSAVLTDLHRNGPLSRADLTRRTGLNRSTTSDLVADLVARGFAYETEPDGLGVVGRPSPVVHANPQIAALTVNPDIDAVTVGLVGLGGVVHGSRRVSIDSPTVDDVVLISHREGSALRLAHPEVRLVGVGVAVPGLVATETGVVRRAPHLAWDDQPIAAPLAAVFDLPVHAANDAYAATLAEATFGAGRAVENLVYLNGSASGIGGGVMINRAPLRGRDGFAGELGHTVVNPRGRRCYCGRTGCLETEVDRARLYDVLQAAPQDPAELAEMIMSGRRPVQTEVDRQLRWLVQGLINFVHIFNPEVVVLGGFLAALETARADSIAESLQQEGMQAMTDAVTVVPAELGTDLLTVGGGELAFTALLADPTIEGRS